MSKLLQQSLPDGVIIDYYKSSNGKLPPPGSPSVGVYHRDAPHSGAFGHMYVGGDFYCCGCRSLGSLQVGEAIYLFNSNQPQKTIVIGRDNTKVIMAHMIDWVRKRLVGYSMSLFYLTAPHQKLHEEVLADLGFKKQITFGNYNHGGHPLIVWGLLCPVGPAYVGKT